MYVSNCAHSELETKSPSQYPWWFASVRLCRFKIGPELLSGAVVRVIPAGTIRFLHDFKSQ
jgi:hypothetical protein